MRSGLELKRIMVAPSRFESDQTNKPLNTTEMQTMKAEQSSRERKALSTSHYGLQRVGAPRRYPATPSRLGFREVLGLRLESL